MAQESTAIIVDCATGVETLVSIPPKNAEAIAAEAARQEVLLQEQHAAQRAAEQARADALQRAKEAGLSDEDIALLSGV